MGGAHPYSYSKRKNKSDYSVDSKECVSPRHEWPTLTKLVDLFATNRPQVSVDSGGGGLYVAQSTDISLYSP